MGQRRVVIIGAGSGGLACALDLAARGMAVSVIERSPRPGGKMREVMVDATPVDSGPTVFTMRWVFEELFAAAGADFAAEVPHTRLDILARHAWSTDERLDLFTDRQKSIDAIGTFAGAAEAMRFVGFCADAARIYATLKDSFLTTQRPNPISLASRIGLHRLAALWAIRPFSTLWGALGEHFHDPRLRQLFGRYSTYVGSSPFAAPATLMLIAHVEQEGVWSIDGGMVRLAEGMQRLAAARGADFKFNAHVREIVVGRGRVTGVLLETGERIECAAVVMNGDPSALAQGLMGASVQRAADTVTLLDRSLSAVTWSLAAETRGFPLSRHNVFFSSDYAAEFADLFTRRRLPTSPTVYVHAQDNGGVLMLVNAPAVGDAGSIGSAEIAACEATVFETLKRCGLDVRVRDRSITSPQEFQRLFPGSGGALYGRATHGPFASFGRPAAWTSIPGLYLAGGAAHPGAGVPMAALSGRLAAQRLCADLRLT